MTSSNGLTLIELMVTLAVLSILIAVAAPNFRSIASSNQSTVSASTLVGSLDLASDEPGLKQVSVSLIATGGNFANGWQVQLTNAPNTVLKETGAVTPQITVTSTGSTTYVFNSDGSHTGSGTIKFCDNTRPAGNHGNQITIPAIGRRSLQKDAACP